MTSSTPEEVCRAVAADLRARGITHQKAAEAIGKTRSIVSNQLASKKPFSKGLASLFAQAFGYNTQYLLYGEGELRGQQGILDMIGVPIQGTQASQNLDLAILVSLLDCAEGILRVIGDKDALDAWHSISKADWDGYTNAMKSLSVKYKGRTANPILARFICAHAKDFCYIPVNSDMG